MDVEIEGSIYLNLKMKEKEEIWNLSFCHGAWET